MKLFRKHRGLRALVVPEANEEYPRILEALGEYPAIHPAPADIVLGNQARRDASSRWLAEQGLYQLPVVELVDWMRERIAGRSALEICAGHGWLGEALGVVSTDGWVLDHPALRVRRALLGEQNCRPLPRVEKLEALDAVRKYRPEVVFGCFCTHLWCPKTRTGSALGVDDAAIFKTRSVQTYILVGARSVHQHRPFLKQSHETYQFPWLFSRGEEPRIWVWNKS